MKTSFTRAAMLSAASMLAGPWAQAQAPAQTQLQMQIYGTIDVAVGQLANQNPGPPTTAVTQIKGVHNGALQTSYWGIRGSDALGGGWSAKFQLESFVRVDTGQNGRFDPTPGGGADPHWSRSSWVGISGPVGELRLGNNGNPLWISMLQSNALGSNSVFSPSFRQLYNGGTRGVSALDTSLVNSVSYETPVFGGLQALAVLQAGEGRGTRYNYAGRVIWRGGPAMLTAAVQSARHAPPPDFTVPTEQDMVLVGGSFNLGFLRLFGQYTTVDNVGNKSKLPHVGFTAPIGVGTLQFSTGEDRVATGVTTKRSTTSLGYVYPLSRRTEIYGFVMTEKFPVVGPAENSGNSGVLGVRHTF